MTIVEEIAQAMDGKPMPMFLLGVAALGASDFEAIKRAIHEAAILNLSRKISAGVVSHGKQGLDREPNRLVEESLGRKASTGERSR